MDENLSQTIFERRFKEFKKMVDVKGYQSVRDMKPLDDAIIAKSESLVKYTVYASESSNLSDIERLIPLRSSLIHHSANKESPLCSRPTCLDGTIQRKIRFLVDSEPRKLDLDPFDALERLIHMQSKLPSRQNDWFCPTEIDTAITQKVNFLAKCMASPKCTPDEGSGSNDIAYVSETCSLDECSAVSCRSPIVFGLEWL